MAENKRAKRKKAKLPVGSFDLRIYVSDEEYGRQHKVLGLNTNLGICSFIRMMLEANEIVSSVKRMTDEQLTKQVVREFPDARSTKKLLSGEYPFGYWRTRYNRDLIGLNKKPKRRSRRYASGGELANTRTGRPLVGVILEMHKREIEREKEKE